MSGCPTDQGSNWPRAHANATPSWASSFSLCTPVTNAVRRSGSRRLGVRPQERPSDDVVAAARHAATTPIVHRQRPRRRDEAQAQPDRPTVEPRTRGAATTADGLGVAQISPPAVHPANQPRRPHLQSCTRSSAQVTRSGTHDRVETRPAAPIGPHCLTCDTCPESRRRRVRADGRSSAGPWLARRWWVLPHRGVLLTRLWLLLIPFGLIPISAAPWSSTT